MLITYNQEQKITLEKEISLKEFYSYRIYRYRA